MKILGVSENISNMNLPTDKTIAFSISGLTAWQALTTTSSTFTWTLRTRWTNIQTGNVVVNGNTTILDSNTGTSNGPDLYFRAKRNLNDYYIIGIDVTNL